MSKYLFELSWEVCNKMGGIHTVISSKIQESQKNFENYYCVGNYIHSNKKLFLEKEIPNYFKKTSELLSERGIYLHFGEWKVNGNPKCILIDYMEHSKNLNDIKRILWESFQIDSLNSNWYDYDEAILWSWTCGIFVEEFSKVIGDENQVLLHAHEWMSGGSIFYIKSQENSRVRTVFTTHATMLGRSISGNNLDLYSLLGKINPQEMAYSLNVQTKHQSEVALAKISDCFSTVSDITAKETKFFYLKDPDVILYNGFSGFESDYDFSIQRKKINDFLERYFYLSCEFDFNNTKILFTSGRNEPRNKGVDVLISAMSKLNKELKEKKSDERVVCFILLLIGEMPEDKHIRDSFDSCKQNLGRKNRKYAPLSTHEIPIENSLIQQLLEEKLFNHEDDRVKIIINPMYLNCEDGFFNRDYYDVTSGCDLGIFPSFYEPWGYTPMESISCGVPTITTDLAGFGRYVQKKEVDFNLSGVEIISRENKTYTEVVEGLYDKLNDYFKKNEKELSGIRENSKKFSKNFNWEKFYLNYLRAYEFALKKDL